MNLEYSKAVVPNSQTATSLCTTWYQTAKKKAYANFNYLQFVYYYIINEFIIWKITRFCSQQSVMRIKTAARTAESKAQSIKSNKKQTNKTYLESFIT